MKVMIVQKFVYLNRRRMAFQAIYAVEGNHTGSGVGPGRLRKAGNGYEYGRLVPLKRA
jgi:hypothetical protein